MVAGLDGGDALADGFNNTGAFVTEDDGESTFRVFSAECISVCGERWSVFVVSILSKDDISPVWQTPV